MTHKGTVTLKTERLILRRFTIDDAEAMFKNWASDPEVTRFLNFQPHADVTTSKAIIAGWVDSYNQVYTYRWAIVPKDFGEPIGYICVGRFTFDVCGVFHIDYCIGKRWWRQGYTSEAAKELVRFLFEEVGVNRVESHHDPRNPNSGNVMVKAGLKFEGILRQSDRNNQGICDSAYYALTADEYFGSKDKPSVSPMSNIETLKANTDLMFYNLHIAMDTVDWNADVCGAPAWRYIYHTLHSADKWFINPSTRNKEPEPAFHTTGLDWPDNPTDKILDRDTLFAYYEQVRQKILSYLDSLNDSQLTESPKGCAGTRLGLALSQFRHMYAHIGILNGITIANTNRYPRVINESTWRSGNLPGLFDE